MKTLQYFNSLNGLKPIIEQSQFYKGISQTTYKELAIDKFNFIVHSILQGNQHKYKSEKTEAVSLHNDILLHQIGRRYIKYLNVLLDANLIETNGSYIKGEHAKRYALTPKALEMEIIKVGILHKNTIRKYETHRRGLFTKLLKDKNIARQFYSISDLYYHAPKDINTFLDELIGKEDTEQRKHYIDWHNQLLQFNSFSTTKDYQYSNFYIMKSKKSGRLYNTFTNIPKEYRKRLTTRTNEKLIEVDGKNSQLFILSNVFYLASKGDGTYIKNKRYTNPILREYKERRKNKDIRMSICMYHVSESQTLLSNLLSNTYDFYNHFIKTKNTMRLEKEIPTNNRSEIKPYVLKAIYGYYKPHLSTEEKVLSNMYPNLLKFIRNAKKTLSPLQIDRESAPHKLFSHMIQNIESDIYVKRFFDKLDNDKLAFSIHDSIVCRKSDEAYVRNLLTECIIEEFKEINFNKSQINAIIK